MLYSLIVSFIYLIPYPTILLSVIYYMLKDTLQIADFSKQLEIYNCQKICNIFHHDPQYLFSKLDDENDGLEAVNITEVEIIQLCNHQPENEMELNLILDYTRCNEKHNDIILATVANCFSVNES